jgi:hypothetical protein
MTTSPLPIDRVLQDERLLGAALGDIGTWATWIAVLKAAFALPLSDDERATFMSVAGGRVPPLKRTRELWCIIGRRGGKSRMAAALAIYFALFVKYKLAAGERGMVLVLAATTDQAKVVFNYVAAFLQASEVLRREVASTTRNEIRLRNGVAVTVHPNSFRSVRGRTLCACVFDEVAFWRDNASLAPDTEVYTAVLPSLVTTSGMLVGISSPYRKTGLMHAKHKQFFGTASDDTLVVQGPTLVFNKTLDPAAIAAQQQADPTAARSEWDAEFRIDISSYLDDATIEAAVNYGRPIELPPQPQAVFRCFVDASGGRHDHYTLAIGHKEGDRIVIDVCRGVAPPFDPQEATEQYAKLASEYRCLSVVGDNFAQEWVAGAWMRCGVRYVRSELPRSQIYLECLPLFARGLVALPDHKRLLRELRLLERHTHRSGRDTVDHGKNGSDDYSNAVCGVLRDLSTHLSYFDALTRALAD